MRALFLPGYRSNPYLAELARALGAEGVAVRIVDGLGPPSLLGRARLFAQHDVVHVHWTHGYLEARSRPRRALKAVGFAASILAARVRGTKLVWTVHNVFAHKGPDVVVERAVSRALVRLASACIVHCDAAAEEIAAAWRLPPAGRRKIVVVPHGHYADSYPAGPPRTEARRKLGLEPDALVFLHVGQLRAYKGIDALLDAFERLDHPRARLVVAGKPKSRAYAARIAERAAAIPGASAFLEAIPDDEIGIYLAAADAVVLPYERILTSGTTVLAMSFGRAVVTPDMGCARSMLGHQGELLYDRTEQGALEAALRRATEMDLDAIGAANRSAALRSGWDLVGRRTAAVYAAALGRGPVVRPSP